MKDLAISRGRFERFVKDGYCWVDYEYNGYGVEVVWVKTGARSTVRFID